MDDDRHTPEEEPREDEERDERSELDDHECAGSRNAEFRRPIATGWMAEYHRRFGGG